MIVSQIKIIGALIYRTREALNEDKSFIERLSLYEFAPNCIVDGKINLWHYPGTPNEISNALTKIGEHPAGGLLKFPSFFNYQTVKQFKAGKRVTINYNIAIVAPVVNEWLTEQRESEVFDRLLRPIYEEFIRQVVKSGWFNTELPYPSHNYYEVFTTGGNQGILLERYGVHIDAIELHNISLTLRTNLCEKDLKTIEEQNKLVTEGFKEILNK